MPCPLCSTDNENGFEVLSQEAGAERRLAAIACRGCGLVYLRDWRADRSGIYDEDYAAWGKSDEAEEPLIAEAKKTAFRQQLKRLARHIGPSSKTLLDVGTGKGYLLEVAAEMGFDVRGVELSPYAARKASAKFPGRIVTGTLADARYPDASFDVVTLTDLIEHVADPSALMREVRRVIRPNGIVFIITPDSDSLSRRILGKRWFQYKYEHVTYWNRATLARLLRETGFAPAESRHNVKKFNLAYYSRHFRKYSLFGIGPAFLAAYRLFPPFLRRMTVTNPATGELLLIARAL